MPKKPLPRTQFVALVTNEGAGTRPMSEDDEEERTSEIELRSQGYLYTAASISKLTLRSIFYINLTSRSILKKTAKFDISLITSSLLINH